MPDHATRGVPSGKDAMRRAGLIHRSIVSVSVALTVFLGVVLAKLHPGVTSNAGSPTATSPSAGISGSSGAISNSSSGIAPSASAPLSQAPVTATGGS